MTTTMIASPIKALFLVTAALVIVSHAERIKADMHVTTMTLPDRIEAWTLTKPPRLINAETIFEYMNGAGELYLGYGFDRLEVREYGDAQANSLLVEIYFMKTADDAFGLLSLDWSGEPVLMDSAQKNAFPSRALYGGGLLRVWTGSVYARLMTFRETASAKAAILSLGHHVIKDRGPTPVPALMSSFPETMPPGWELRRDRMGYFRSHLVLNSLYYLSHQNIFNLDLSAEAVTAPFERQSGQGHKERVQALLINYATHQKAREGLERFHAAYLDDFQKEKPSNDPPGRVHYFQIEDGWLAYALNGSCLAVVFECPNKTIAGQLLNTININAQ